MIFSLHNGLSEFVPPSNFLYFLVPNTYKHDRIGPAHVFQCNPGFPLTHCAYPNLISYDKGVKSHGKNRPKDCFSSKAAGGGIEQALC